MGTKQEQQELKETFNIFDINGDGKIELDEFIQSYRKVYPHLTNDHIVEEATAFFKTVDVKGNGSIDFGEWSAATIHKRTLLTDKNLKTAFNMFDRDGGGTISATEVAEILGHNMSKDQHVWDEIIKQVDIDGDGLISYEEFH